MLREGRGVPVAQAAVLLARRSPAVETAAQKREAIERRLTDAAIFALETGNMPLLQFLLLEPSDRKRLLNIVFSQQAQLSPYLISAKAS